LRTLKLKISGIVPGRFAIASSPSHVLQTQPFFEIFCTYPARSPFEYEKLSVTQAHVPKIRAGRRSINHTANNPKRRVR